MNLHHANATPPPVIEMLLKLAGLVRALTNS